MPARTPSRASRALWLVNLGFVGITAVTALGVATSTYFAQRVRGQTHILVENATESVDLVTRMGNVVSQLHAQVLSTVHRGSPEALDALTEARHTSEVSFMAYATRYDPLTTFPYERVEWQVMRSAVQGYLSTVDRVIALARSGNGAGADVLFHEVLDPSLARIDEVGARLVEINIQQSGTIRDRIDDAHGTAVKIDVAMGLVVVALLLLIRRVVVRRLVAEEVQRGRYIALLSTRNRDLDEFSSRIAHDLKGLINPVTGYAELLLERPEDPATVQQYAGRIARKTDEVVAMVDELLRLSRAGRASDGPTKPLPVVTSMVEACEVDIAAAGAQVDFAVDAPPLALSEVALREVVQNLLSNALKYRSPARPARIRIALRARAGNGVLEVVDNGLGMSPAVAARAAEPFFRAATEHDVAGSGLGLAIVRRIAEVHDGSLVIESQEGHGTTVRVTLPLWQPDITR